MKKETKKINKYMFVLLVEIGMDNFTVVELRNGFVEISGGKYSLDEARKYVYRQTLAFVRKGWVESTGKGRLKIYAKTDLFKSLTFSQQIANKKHRHSSEVTPLADNFSVLIKEKSTSEGELAIVLGEVEEYQTLLSRFPTLNPSINTLFEEAKDRSAKLLGKINALSNVIELSKSEQFLC